MIEVLGSRLYRWRALAPWLLVEALLHGAALVALLAWLTYRYLTDGFGGIRQHALTPASGRASVAAAAPRKWWDCRCGDRCECLAAFARGLRRGCARMFAATA